MPYVPTPYDYGPSSRISELILRQGQQRAENAGRSGEILGNAVANLGQQIGGAVQQIGERKAASKRAAAFEAAIQTGDPREIIRVLGPKDGPAVVNALSAHQPDGMKRYGDRMTLLRDQARGILALPPEHRERGYQFARQGLLTSGVIQPQEAPEAYDEPTLKQLAAYGQAEPKAPGTREVKTRNPDGSETVRIVPDVPGFEQTGAPPVPQPPAVGSFEDYVTQQFGARPTPQQIEQARKKYQQADDRPFRPIVPIVIQGAEGPMLLDRGSRTAAPITDASGKAVGQAPTSEQRNKAAARTTAAPVLQSIAELSEKINTGQGALAKIVGSVEKAKAQANLSDDVAEYQALVSGFTPMLARMVGHTGVLTEQDVQSVRTMLPQPGDSKNVRDRKMARIQKILGAQNAGPGGGGDPLGIR